MNPCTRCWKDDELDLTKLREVAEAATPGPWESVVSTYSSEYSDYEGARIPGVAEDISDYYIGTVPPLEVDDAAHIATFDPPTVLELIDEIERLRETLATVKAITDGTPECDKYDDKSPVTCGWKFDLQRIKEVVK